MNRLTPQEQESFGLVAWLEQTRVVLPLRAVEVEFQVQGDLLNVEMDQVFHQNNTEVLDVAYTFPLPAGASVYRCEMHVNGRVIRAEVEEEQEARLLVEEQKNAGHRTALVEVTRENLFTLFLGNISPGDVVVIRLAYLQTVSRLADWVSFNVPFCPGIRYVPGKPLLRSPTGQGTQDDTDEVPDASRISPPRLDRLDPDVASVSLHGTVDGLGCGLSELSSPTHPVVVRDESDRFAVCLAERGALPDRDFVLRWTEVAPKELEATAWVDRSGDAVHALIRLQAPAPLAVDSTASQDIYFLLDRSGSMEGLKWKKTAAAFLRFLELMGPNQRVFATTFESSWKDVVVQPLSAAELLRDPGVQSLPQLATGDETELAPALAHVLERITTFSTGRPCILILITDGEIGNETAVLAQFESTPGLTVHTVGIDTTVNDSLLKSVADQHQGTCTLLTPNDDIVGAVSRLAGCIQPPVLRDIQLPAGWESGDSVWRYLHAGKPTYLPVRATSGTGELSLIGLEPGGARRELPVRIVEKALPAIGLLWARARMGSYLRENKQSEAIELGKRHNLICLGACFVAWDESEQVTGDLSRKAIYQPSMVPVRIGSGSDLDDRELCCYDSMGVDELTNARWLIEDWLLALQPDISLRGGAVERLISAWFVGLSDCIVALPRESLTAPSFQPSLAKLIPSFASWFEARGFQDSDAVEFLLSLWRWALDPSTNTPDRFTKLSALADAVNAELLDQPGGLDAIESWLQSNVAPKDPEAAGLQNRLAMLRNAFSKT